MMAYTQRWFRRPWCPALRTQLRAAVCVLLVAPQPLMGQREATDRAPAAVGIAVGVPGADGQLAPEFSMLAVHATSTRPHRIGVQGLVGTVPIAILYGVVTLGGRAGLVFPVPIAPDVLLLPSGGIAFGSALGNDGASLNGGIHAGTSLMYLRDGGGLMLGLSWYRSLEVRTPVWVVEFGFVFRRKP